MCPGSTLLSFWFVLRICLDGGAKIDPVLRPELAVYASSTLPALAGSADGREGLIPPGTGPEVFRAMGVTTSCLFRGCTSDDSL